MKTQILKIFIIVVTVFSNLAAATQTLHSIIVADTKDPSIGDAKKQDLKHMNSLAHFIAQALGYEVKQTIFEPKYSILFGRHFNSSEITSTLLDLKIGKNDVVVFYYGGHGTSSTEADDPFARVTIAGDKHSYLSLKMVQNLINIKQPRFSLVMGDLCNGNYADPGEPNFKRQRVKWQKLNPLNRLTTKNIKSLFLNAQGHVTVTSSQPGTLSYAQIEGGEYSGGIFAILFQNNFLKAIESPTPTSWDQIFEKTSFATKERMNRTPYYEINLNTVN